MYKLRMNEGHKDVVMGIDNVVYNWDHIMRRHFALNKAYSLKFVELKNSVESSFYGEEYFVKGLIVQAVTLSKDQVLNMTDVGETCVLTVPLPSCDWVWGIIYSARYEDAHSRTCASFSVVVERQDDNLLFVKTAYPVRHKVDGLEIIVQ